MLGPVDHDTARVLQSMCLDSIKVGQRSPKVVFGLVASDVAGFPRFWGSLVIPALNNDK